MSYQLSPKQIQVWKTLQQKKAKYILVGGGMGGGKSRIIAFLILGLALDQPNTRYAVFRKNMTVLKRTTYLTFKAVAAELGIVYQENRADMTWTIQNGSTIYFIEVDETKDPDFNKLKGLELTGAGIDEANEVNEQAFSILKLRIGRCNTHGEFAFMLLSCNPAQNWVKYAFYDRYVENKLPDSYAFVQMLAQDNPFLPKAYFETFGDLPEAEYQRYVLGNWNYSDDPSQLIKFEWLKENQCAPEDSASFLGIDVARYGDDKTVFGFRNENRLVKLKEITHQDTHTVAEMAIEEMKDLGIGFQNAICDVVGLGAGVVDTCRAKGYMIREFNGGENPETLQREIEGHTITSALLFKNMRAYAYWNLRMLLQEGKIKIIENQELYKQLLATKYVVKDKVIHIESKDEIKKRLGKSPDYADVASMIFTLGIKRVTVSTGKTQAFSTISNHTNVGSKRHSISQHRTNWF